MSRYIGPAMLLVGVVAGADSSGTVLFTSDININTTFCDHAPFPVLYTATQCQNSNQIKTQ